MLAAGCQTFFVIERLMTKLRSNDLSTPIKHFDIAIEGSHDQHIQYKNKGNQTPEHVHYISNYSLETSTSVID